MKNKRNIAIEYRGKYLYWTIPAWRGVKIKKNKNRADNAICRCKYHFFSCLSKLYFFSTFLIYMFLWSRKMRNRNKNARVPRFFCAYKTELLSICKSLNVAIGKSALRFFSRWTILGAVRIKHASPFFAIFNCKSVSSKYRKNPHHRKHCCHFS